MGIEYSAQLIVGLPRHEIEDEDVLDDLSQAAPYYDGWQDAIVGVCVEDSGDYSAKEISLDQGKVDRAMQEFREKTGQEGKLYLTPCGT